MTSDHHSSVIADLHRVKGRAELIGGRMVSLPPTGHRPSEIAAEIYVSLRNYARVTGNGRAYTDTLGYAVPELTSGRESFSPEASYYDGPPPADEMDFVPGPPTFAAEVRSKSDYGPAAERDMADKRADYFEAGTKVVWDVDTLEGLIRSYSADAPDRPVVFIAGQTADAEPAVPGWSIAVDDVFA